MVRFLTREIITRFSISSEIGSDSETELRTKWRLVCVYHPQSQGMVKRVNESLKVKSNRLCADTKITLPLYIMLHKPKKRKEKKMNFG